mmetsp:Transcript_84254/g.239364  ORF Transcript_84254/g.239364 Transcript_84254/m.239364 type:complete len:236 (+) Transcript_84254:2309-3016(+)
MVRKLRKRRPRRRRAVATVVVGPRRLTRHRLRLGKRVPDEAQSRGHSSPSTASSRTRTCPGGLRSSRTRHRRRWKWTTPRRRRNRRPQRRRPLPRSWATTVPNQTPRAPSPRLWPRRRDRLRRRPRHRLRLRKKTFRINYEGEFQARPTTSMRRTPRSKLRSRSLILVEPACSTRCNSRTCSVRPACRCITPTSRCRGMRSLMSMGRLVWAWMNSRRASTNSRPTSPSRPRWSSN